MKNQKKIRKNQKQIKQNQKKRGKKQKYIKKTKKKTNKKQKDNLKNKNKSKFKKSTTNLEIIIRKNLKKNMNEQVFFGIKKHLFGPE